MGTEVSSEDGRRQPASGRQQRSPGPAWGQAKEKATEAGERLDGARAERGGAAPSRADGDRKLCSAVIGQSSCQPRLPQIEQGTDGNDN